MSTLPVHPIHQFLKQIKIDEVLWVFNAVSLYPSGMWDENSISPGIETGYAYTEDMNEKLVKKFYNGNFTKGSAVLKIKYYNPKILIVQRLPVKERERKMKLIVCEMVII